MTFPNIFVRKTILNHSGRCSAVYTLARVPKVLHPGEHSSLLQRLRYRVFYYSLEHAGYSSLRYGQETFIALKNISQIVIYCDAEG